MCRCIRQHCQNYTYILISLLAPSNCCHFKRIYTYIYIYKRPSLPLRPLFIIIPFNNSLFLSTYFLNSFHKLTKFESQIHLIFFFLTKKIYILFIIVFQSVETYKKKKIKTIIVLKRKYCFFYITMLE